MQERYYKRVSFELITVFETPIWTFNLVPAIELRFSINNNKKKKDAGTYHNVMFITEEKEKK